MDKEPLSLNILSLLRGNSFLTVSLPLAHKIGLLETIYLMDLLSKHDYHLERNELTTINGVDGYFYACIDDMQKRTTMCRSTQDSCMKKLNLLGLVSHVVKGVPPKRYFKINIGNILEIFGVQIKSPNLLDSANQFAHSDKLICQDQQIDLLKSANPIIRNTRSDILDQRNTTTEQPPQDKIVVISSHLKKLKLQEAFKQKISEEYSDADIKLAVDRCLKWKGRINDEAGLITALKQKDTWNDVESAQETSKRIELDIGSLVEENRTWARIYAKQVEAKNISVTSLVKLTDTGVTVKIKNRWAPLGYADEKFREVFMFLIKQALEDKN